MQQHPQTRTRPFLKWAGGKQRLLKTLLPLLPPGKRLIEPFLGAGSVFLGTDYASYVLNDANPDLVAAWVSLKERPAPFILEASALFCEANRSHDRYLALRDEFNSSSDAYSRAVLLPYLNCFGFNGLYRVNKAGAFNVPFGKPTRLPLFPFDEMFAAAVRLRRAKILSGDFQAAMDVAASGDIVYCDPPYHSSSKGASFSAYTSNGFTDADHLRLLECANAAAARGTTVLISNHDTPLTRKLYRDCEVHRLNVNRSIASTRHGRGNCEELVAILRPSAAVLSPAAQKRR